MNTSKTTHVLVLILLGISVLSGCKSSSPRPSVAPATTQPDETPTTESADPIGTPAESVEATSPPSTPSTDETVILVADEITTLEPFRMAKIHPDGSIASHLWDTLTLLNDELQVEPHVAESWRVVNNFTWEFKLRQGITFHNGEPLDARAVRFSIERARSMPGSLETFAQDIDLQQVEIVDDYTLRLITHQPVVNLPFHATFLEILPPTYYSETPTDQLATAPVGSGPYQVDQWLPGEKLILTAVPTYWKGAPALTRLVFQTVPRAEDRLDALRDEQAALVTNLPPTPPGQWNSFTSRIEAIESTQRMFVGIRIEEQSPLADKHVRQALNYGVNVEQIVDDWLEGYGERYGSWVNPPANNPELTPWPYDPDQARGLLAQAGYQAGLTATLHLPADTYYQDMAIATAIVQQLADINIAVEIEAVDWTAYVHELLSDAPPSLFLLGLNSRGDGLEDVKNLSAAFAFNPTKWQNKVFEDTLEQALSTFNQASQTRLIYEAQAIAYADAPWIWLWRQYDFYGIAHSLDWTPRRDGLVCLYRPVTVPSEENE